MPSWFVTHGEAAERVQRIIRDLAEVREAAGISQYRLAKLTGLSREAVRLIEIGARSPTLHSLLVISAALGIKLGDFVARREGE